MACWSELPKDLLRLIANCVVTYTDQVRFACICTSWNSVSPTIPSKKIQPWLLLPRDGKNEQYERFYSPGERKVHYLEVPEVLGKQFRGSSQGWLLSIGDSPKISLINPITRVEIALPPRYKFPDVREYCPEKFDTEYALEAYEPSCNTLTHLLDASHVHYHYLEKLVLSSSPSSSKSNVMVAAIYGSHCNLAYWKLGDKSWTCLYKGFIGYCDAIFIGEKLYAVNAHHMEVFELSAFPKKVEFIELPPRERAAGRNYLVSSSIGLLYVQRSMKGFYETTHFGVYKYVPSSRSWCKVENIGENVVFVGLNSSISVAASSLSGFKGNCIYFTDNILDFHCAGEKGGHDGGVYDLDSRRIESLPYHDTDKKWLWPTPIWYIHKPEDFIN